MTPDRLKQLRALSDRAHREDSIAGLEAHYEQLRSTLPELLDEVEHLCAALAEACDIAMQHWAKRQPHAEQRREAAAVVDALRKAGAK